ncbi:MULTISPECIES: hypothetical protein [unclassified Spiroplasma]|uniref:hypothetical protein n=1 Tax=unclassified Spiroplasma TaxID=2637901 RepID=UPI00313D3479
MINNSNLKKETKNINPTNIGPDGLIRAGLIITIVSSGIILFLALILLPFTLIGAGVIGFIFGVFWIINIILVILAVMAIITNSLVLSKKSQNYILAGIFGIFFGFIIGGILVLCGKFKSLVLASPESNMNSSNIK